MKRYIFSLVLVLFAVQFTYAQDLNKFMSEFSEIEGAEKQVVDREMLNMSMNAAMEADSTGELKSKMPPFMQKIESIEVVSIEEYKPEVKDMFMKEFDNFNDGNGYTTLLTVKDGEDNVRIISYKEGDKNTAVFILVLDDEDAVIVKMSGELNESDLEDIIKEQNKNK